jgi:glycerol-3-phosphate dehydrogenase (NAD+)
VSQIRNSVWEFLKAGPLRVAIIGSGNWGSAVAKIIGVNTKKAFFFEDKVKMYVYEETFNGKKLHDIINERHVNEKYLPGIKLPDNIIASPDIHSVVAGAHVLVFVMPHQFIKPLCTQMQGHILPGAKGISLVKGFDCELGRINLMSEYIRKTLNIDCASLSGANVAEGVAAEQFSETTIGYAPDDYESAQLFQSLFDTPYFRVNAVADVAGVEICGALKNVIALAAGFCDGLGYGSNTKAALLRIGMYEMRKFAGMFYSDTIDEVFWDSAG